MKKRTEVDALGTRLVSKTAYYGIQTIRAVENFPVSGLKAPVNFIRAYIFVKKASALANMHVGWLDDTIGLAIVKACDEILDGKFLDQFVVDVFQAGAGTSFNMNVNEVLANRALEILGEDKGNYEKVNPNDHVNMAQSSNDTFPTALHIAALLELHRLLSELNKLVEAFNRLADEYGNVIKSGRTHLQDALPVSIGQEFSAYATAIKNARDQVRNRGRRLQELALGATAVGTGATTHPKFKKKAIAKLSAMTGLRLKEAENPFESLQSRNGIAAVSSALKELALELIRIANDLRLLSSGPTTGLAEITLPPVQPGSSIMPGKINPVIAECMNMIAFHIIGNDLACSLAVQAGQLELNVMTPVMMYNVLQSFQLLNNYIPVFVDKCLKKITVDKEKCISYVSKNPSLAVFLSPHIGHLKASKISGQALRKGRSVSEVAIEKDILTPEEAKKIFSPTSMLNVRRKKREKKDKVDKRSCAT